MKTNPNDPIRINTPHNIYEFPRLPMRTDGMTREELIKIKREFFSFRVLQGMLASTYYHNVEHKDIVDEAVELTDALIQKLNEGNKDENI